MAAEIDRLVREDDAYEQARIEALADLESDFDLGSDGRLPAREAAYDRCYSSDCGAQEPGLCIVDPFRAGEGSGIG